MAEISPEADVRYRATLIRLPAALVADAYFAEHEPAIVDDALSISPTMIRRLAQRHPI
jgi:hypothetical protein